MSKRDHRLWLFSHRIENTLRRRRPHAWHELQEPKPRHPIARVLREAQHGQHVFDVSAIEEFQAAELDEGNVAPCELDLKMAAVAGRPEKNRLLFQDGARFPVLQHTVSDIASLSPAWPPKVPAEIDGEGCVEAGAACHAAEYALGHR